MNAESPESEQWTAALRGDSRAFSAVFDRHYDRVFRHVIGLSEQQADADEITAAAFFELWRLRAKVRLVNGSVLPWLLVTAGNIARNHRRRLQRYRHLLRRLPRDEQSVDAAALVADRHEEAERAAALALALRRLTPTDAQLVALTSKGELPVQEAAAILGLSSGAARVRLHRVRARLRDTLGPELDRRDVEEAR